MGRQPQPKSEKETRGTFRPERDRTVTISSGQEIPEPPDSLDAIGLHFWELAYQQPWIGPADQVQVLNVARRCSRQPQLSPFFATKSRGDDAAEQVCSSSADRKVLWGGEKSSSGNPGQTLRPHSKRGPLPDDASQRIQRGHCQQSLPSHARPCAPTSEFPGGLSSLDLDTTNSRMDAHLNATTSK